MTGTFRNERERIFAFAIRWLPYGGGPAVDIRVDFDIAPRTYFSRLVDLLTDPDRPIDLDGATKWHCVRSASGGSGSQG